MQFYECECVLVSGLWCKNTVVGERGGGRTAPYVVPKGLENTVCSVVVVGYLFVGLHDNQFVYIFQLHTHTHAVRVHFLHKSTHTCARKDTHTPTYMNIRRYMCVHTCIH